MNDEHDTDDRTDAAWKRGVVFGLQRAAAHLRVKGREGSCDTEQLMRKLARELDELADRTKSCDKKD